jgi:hypothetical protein
MELISMHLPHITSPKLASIARIESHYQYKRLDIHVDLFDGKETLGAEIKSWRAGEI